MLEDLVQKITSQNDLSRSIASVATELNIARRNWNAYPPGHPVVESSLQKLSNALQNLILQQSPVQIGITRDGLLLGDEYVEKNNNVCRFLASSLFELGIGALILNRTPDNSELKALIRILTMKREEVLAAAGIESLWADSQISSIHVRGIRYDRFGGTEESSIEHELQADNDEQPNSLWERFVRLMMQGEIGAGSGDAVNEISPEALAAALNTRFAQRKGGGGFPSGSIKSSVNILRNLLSAKTTEDLPADNRSTPPEGTTAAPDQTGLMAFIAALDPTLRRNILDGFCETSDDSDKAATEELFRHLGPTIIQETYASAEEYSAAPPLLQAILRKLAPHLSDE